MPKSVPGRISDFWGQLKKHDLKVRLQPEEHPLAASCHLPMSGVESSVGCGSDTWRLCSLARWMPSDCSNDRRPWTQFFPTHTTLANSATLEHPWADTDRHRWVRASCPFSLFFTSSVSGFPAQPAPSRNVKGRDLSSPYCHQAENRWTMDGHPRDSSPSLQNHSVHSGGPQQMPACPLCCSPQLRARLGTQRSFLGSGLPSHIPEVPGSG